MTSKNYKQFVSRTWPGPLSAAAESLSCNVGETPTMLCQERKLFGSNFRIRCHGEPFSSCYNCYQLLPVATIATSCYQSLPIATNCYNCYQLLQYLPVATSCYQLLPVSASCYNCYQSLPVATNATSRYQLLPVTTSRFQVDTSCCCCLSFSGCWTSVPANGCFVFINSLLFQEFHPFEPELITNSR